MGGQSQHNNTQNNNHQSYNNNKNNSYSSSPMQQSTTTSYQKISKEEVLKHNDEDDAWVIVNNYVYDISDFIDAHPGGSQILIDHLGTDITYTLQDPKTHKHSRAAYSMLEQYCIGQITTTSNNNPSDHSNHFMGYENLTDHDKIRTSPSTQNKINQMQRGGIRGSKTRGRVDFSKPLVPQVGALGHDYYEWVENDPVFFKDPVTLLENPYCEMTTHNPWWIVPSFWLPVIALLNYMVYQYYTLDLVSHLSYFVAGFFLWFVLEFNLHRYLFHWDTLAQLGNYYTNILHFLLHGFHHKVPMDKDRLVVPIPVVIAVGGPIFALASFIFPPPQLLLMTAGALLGYIYYDMHHYWLHHAANLEKAPQPFRTLLRSHHWQSLKTHHFIHHYAPRGEEFNFGISNRMTDRLLGTLREKHQLDE